MKFRLIDSTDPFWQIAKNYAENCSWRAGKNLAFLMEENQFSDWEKVIVVTENEDICGFCTVQKNDCIPDVPYTPYVSYIFVDQKYRGNRLSQLMIQYAERYLKNVGFSDIYLISDHENLYEKYGFVVIDRKVAPWGSVEKIYRKEINISAYTE